MTNRELLETIVIKLESIDQRLGRVEPHRMIKFLASEREFAIG